MEKSILHQNIVWKNLLYTITFCSIAFVLQIFEMQQSTYRGHRGRNHRREWPNGLKRFQQLGRFPFQTPIDALLFLFLLPLLTLLRTRQTFLQFTIIDSISLQPTFGFITIFYTKSFHLSGNIVLKQENKWKEMIIRFSKIVFFALSFYHIPILRGLLLIHIASQITFIGIFQNFIRRLIISHAQRPLFGRAVSLLKEKRCFLMMDW